MLDLYYHLHDEDRRSGGSSLKSSDNQMTDSGAKASRGEVMRTSIDMFLPESATRCPMRQTRFLPLGPALRVRPLFPGILA
jgi:hypothetical protein